MRNLGNGFTSKERDTAQFYSVTELYGESLEVVEKLFCYLVDTIGAKGGAVDSVLAEVSSLEQNINYTLLVCIVLCYMGATLSQLRIRIYSGCWKMTQGWSDGC